MVTAYAFVRTFDLLYLIKQPFLESARPFTIHNQKKKPLDTSDQRPQFSRSSASSDEFEVLSQLQASQTNRVYAIELQGQAQVRKLKESGRRLPLRRPIWSRVLTPRNRMFTGEVNIPIILFLRARMQQI